MKKKKIILRWLISNPEMKHLEAGQNDQIQLYQVRKKLRGLFKMKSVEFLVYSKDHLVRLQDLRSLYDIYRDWHKENKDSSAAFSHPLFISDVEYLVEIQPVNQNILEKVREEKSISLG